MKIEGKYEHIYKEKNPLTGRWSWFGAITKNNKPYKTGNFSEQYQFKEGSNYIKVLINNPEKLAALALDKLIIKNGLDVPLQILKPK